MSLDILGKSGSGTSENFEW